MFNSVVVVGFSMVVLRVVVGFSEVVVVMVEVCTSMVFCSSILLVAYLGYFAAGSYYVVGS